MAPPRKYPDELRQRAVRLVMDAQKNPNDRRGACTRIGAQLGIPADTIRGWVRTAEIDQGVRPGTSTDDATRLAELEREVAGLRRANAILRSASAFFAAHSPLAKKIDACFRISLDSFKPRTSARNRLISSSSLLLEPSITLASTWAWITHRRSDSVPTPSFGATALQAASTDG